MARSLQELAKEALAAQYAPNFSGLHYSYVKAIEELRTHVKTHELPRHPITRLWMTQLHSLCGLGMSDPDNYGPASRDCEALAAGKELAVA
jgi:hypothetical protein